MANEESSVHNGASPADRSTSDQSGRTTLAVVDDAPGLVRLLRTVLSRDSRFEVVAEGEDGLQAIRFAEELHPHVMLLDISMPRLDGIAAASRIREVSPSTLVVMYTAHADRGLAEQALKAGAVSVIGKDRPIEEIPDELDRILRAHRRLPVVPGRGDRGEQLRQSEERFRLLVEAVEDYAIFMLDPQGVIVSWNSGAQRIKGYSASEIIGRHFRTFYPEQKQQERYPEYELDEALRHGQFEEEGWRVRKDGTLMWANVLITPVYDTDGEHIGFAKVTRDITERRKHLQEREESARRLARLNDELARANQDLAATAAQRADFLAVTAHELRTPISVISGSANALTSYWEELDRREREDLLGAISTSAVRLSRLLNDLLTAAKLESGSMELTLSPVRLTDVLETAASTAKVSHREHPPTIQVQDDLTVLADRDRLAQAIDNLLHNAYRHGEPPVEIDLRHLDGTAEIRVRDAGGGISVEARPRLFQRYVSGGNKSGTGLGLFIVRELARAHGGDAWWEDAGPEGPHAFVISLPGAERYP